MKKTNSINKYLLGQQSLASQICRGMGAVTHFIRWSCRFQSFGFRSRLISPDLLTRPDLVHIGKRVSIWKSARIEVVVHSNQVVNGDARIEIGDGSVIHPYFHCGAAESVKIGAGVLIASRVFITDHDHVFDDPNLSAGQVCRLSVCPVVIEDGVWIGEGAVVLKGVRIGRRSVIGANAVVTHDVPDRSVVVGNPSRIIRTLEVEQ